MEARLPIAGVLTVALVALAGGVLGSVPVAGQEEPRGPALRESIDVRLVHLDAVVTDRRGGFVRDLEPADFVLRVDGERVEVTGVSSGLDRDASVVDRTTVVVVVDESNLLQRHRDHALDQIEEGLLDEMAAKPLWVSVVALSTEGLDPLLAPSRSREEVASALGRARSREIEASELTSIHRSMSVEVRDVLEQLARPGSSQRYGQAALGSLVERSRAYGELLAAHTHRTLSELTALVEAVSFVPGRKALLLVTDGLARSPLDLLADTMNDRLAGGSSIFEGRDTIEGSGDIASINTTNVRPTGTDLGHARGESVRQTDDGGAGEFQRIVSQVNVAPHYDLVTALANAHRVTFYPVKAPVVDSAAAGLGNSAAEHGSLMALTDMSAGLDALAQGTGGLSSSSGRGLGDFVEKTRQDLSSYYSLSFRPPDDLAGTAVREVELKVRRGKTRVRHRTSYVPVSIEQRLARRAWGTLLFDWPENLHGLEVDVSEPDGPEGPEAVERAVQVLVSLPIGELELTPLGDVVSGDFRAVVLVRTANGVRLEPQNLAFAVRIPKAEHEQAKAQYFALRTEMELPVGAHDMAVGLWEENSGRASYVVRRVRVGEVDPTVAVLGAGPEVGRVARTLTGPYHPCPRQKPLSSGCFSSHGWMREKASSIFSRSVE